VTPLRWTEGALADLDHIRRYVSAFDQGAARRLADRIATAAQALLADDLPIGVTDRPIVAPYMLRVGVDDDGMIVHAVRHAASAWIA